MENKKEKNEDAVEVKETSAPEDPVVNAAPAPVPVPAAQPAAPEKASRHTQAPALCAQDRGIPEDPCPARA